MRTSFLSGVSRPVAKRKEQLRALKRFMVENEKDIIAALHKDLGRPQFESYLYDVLFPTAEIDVSRITSYQG